MLANAEVVKQSGGHRLVGVTCEGDAVEQYLPAPEYAPRDRNGRRVQEHDIDGVGAEMRRHRVADVTPDAMRIGRSRHVNRHIDVTARRQGTGRGAAEQVRELNRRCGLRDRGTERGQPRVDLRRPDGRGHGLSIRLAS